MQSIRRIRITAAETFAACAFVVAGLAWSPLLLAGAWATYGLVLARHNRLLGGAGLACTAAFLLFVAGYGIGKDLAMRDRQVEAAQVR